MGQIDCSLETLVEYLGDLGRFRNQKGASPNLIRFCALLDLRFGLSLIEAQKRNSS